MTGRITEGSPEPLGVTPDARGVNVAVFSAHATAIELCLFDDAGERELERIRLPERSGNVFHGHVAGVAPGARYGLRAHGPFAPAEGQRFNAAKLLVEPYARLLDRPFRLHPSMLPYPEGADDLAFDASDSAPHMPKAIVLPPNAPLSGHAPLAAWADTVVYELHVKGFTKRHPDVRAEAQGTFAGLSHPAAIEHLVKLGITTVELMPTAAWIEERHLVSLGLSNYWGYNPVALMAPEPRLAPGGWDEVRRTVAALADAGIETVVDVVLNHSGEGDALGPTLSLRGLDNATYYRLHPDDPRRYIDDSGCGNTLALHRAPVVRLVMDSLRTWVREAEIHGFRFDLAACMGRRPDGFDPEAPLLAALEQDPELRHLKLIAEPWDIGPGGYQVGKFPPGWGEWNDRFRDDARRFWRGDHHQLGPLATRLAGSADLFGRHRPPSRSVNFLTAHDGFALADLVAHETKKNEENGEQNRDGSNANYSWNSGCEGETEDAAILAYRTRDQRALLATLLLARGTPMLSMGAELGHSQRGNNNCYAQDNEISWLDWSRADRPLVDFTAKLIALRRAHPLLRRDRVLDGEAGAEGLADVEWLSPEGKPMAPGDWDTPEAGSLTMVLGGGGERMAVLIHRGRDSRAFTLPPPRPGHDWHLLLDSGGGREASRVEGALEIGPRSVALLAETASGDGSGGGGSDAVDRLAEAAGIQPTWWTVDGSRHDVTEDTKRHLLAAIRLPAGSDAEARDSLARLAEQRDLRPLPPVLAGREAEPIAVQLASERGLRRPVWLSVEGPEGEVARVLASPASAAFRRSRAADGRAFERSEVHLPSLAPGRYTIRRDDSPDVACRLTVAPKQAWLPESVRSGRKLFGIAAQLYSLRRPGDQGIGDFTALAELAARSAAAGAAAVGINPLHAMFQGERERASPYQPSDRRFLDPIYLDLEALRGLPGGEAIGAVPAVGTDLIDYTSVWAVKDTALRLLFAGFQPHELDGFTAEGGEALRTFATYCAIARRHGERWPDWPSALRDPASADVAALAGAEAQEIRYQIFLQWLCERQFAAACEAAGAMEVGIYRDLAVGAAPDGAEAWASQALLARGVSVGAPPDPFSPTGQVWGLPPPDPHRMALDGYDSFAALLRANMAHAGALRIDHAMGLARLFWVPDGAEGRDGAYVSYPLQDLLGEVALASREARCMVVGEDLGTVPEGFREVLAANDILGYRVMLLEREGAAFRAPEHYPPLSLACLTSHDLPTFAGWWRGADIGERVAVGQLDDAEAAASHREEERRALLRELGGPTGEDESHVAAEAHRRLAQGASALVMVQADDLSGEETAVNLPGTDAERPNWRRRLSRSVDELFTGEGGKILEAVRDERR